MTRPTRARASSDLDSPVEPSFAALDRANRAGAPGLRTLLAWQVARSGLRLATAAFMALLFGRLIMGEPVAPWLVAAAGLALLGATLAGYVAERSQAGSEAQVAIGLREAAAARLRAMPARQIRALPAGALTIALQRHPEALASLAVGHRAATATMAAGPLLAAGTLAIVSWQSALLVLLLTPVMIVFFVLVGGTIRARAEEQEKAFGRLAGQFADRMRTLPTILANDALESEEAKLALRLDGYVARTMGVLRLAFLNAALIDFFASLSIAMLAVFLGLGHLGLATIPGFSGLALWQSLFVLMVAPEYYAPFRRFSEQYHAKAEGLAAAAGLDRLLDAAAPAPSPALPSVERALAARILPAHGLVAVAGPSGAGKSTLLRRIAGLEPGTDALLPPGGCIWIATDVALRGDTLAAAIADGLPRPDDAALHRTAERLGLLEEALLPGGLDAPIRDGGANLSGGQRLRIAVARALLSDRAVLADEPTAKLDPATARAVRGALGDIARHRLVVVASHDPELIGLAGHRIDLAPAQTLEAAA